MRKVIIVFLMLVFGGAIGFGQSWDWVKNEILGGDVGYAGLHDKVIATDDSGNTYVYTDWSFNIDSLQKYDKNGNYIWGRGNKGSATISDAAVCFHSQYEYLAGTFVFGSLIFGNDTLYNASHYDDAFLIKYNVNGNVLWSRQSQSLGLQGRALATSATTDKYGNSFETGTFGDTVAFGIDTLMQPKSLYVGVFLTKYDINGNVKWVRTGLPTDNKSYATTISVITDSNGNSLITGDYEGAICFGNDTLKNSGSITNLFLAKFDSSGNLLWAIEPKIIAGMGNSTGNSITTDATGSIYLAGVYSAGTFSLGSFSLPSSVYYLPFLIKINPGGTLSWIISGVELSFSGFEGVSVAMDKFNNGYLLSDNEYLCSCNLIFGTDTFDFSTKNETGSVFVQFDTTGKVLCGTIFSEGNEDDGDGICVSPNGKYIYVTGDISDTGVFGTDTLIPSFNDELFLARWNSCNNSFEGITPIQFLNPSISLFPNPNNGAFTLQVVSSQWSVDSKMQVEIYNVLGGKVYSATPSHLPQSGGGARPNGSSGQASVSYGINISSQPNGIYLYRVLNEDGVLLGQGKIVVEK